MTPKHLVRLPDMLPGKLHEGDAVLAWFIDFVLHLDKHLVDLVSQYHYWVYGILFAIVFCETGLVVTPILPGDSLLFATGALTAVDTSGTLIAPALCVLLGLAAVLGNTVNYSVGRFIGPAAFTGRYRLLKVEYLQRTEQFFVRYGGLAIFLSRFMPIIRTFMPFVAGIGHMPYARFQGFNFLGGFLWVALFIYGGYLFGNIPVVKHNFALVTLFIVVVSLLPMLIALVRNRGGRGAAAA